MKANDISSKSAYLLFTNTLYNLDRDLFPYVKSNEQIRCFVNMYGSVG